MTDTTAAPTVRPPLPPKLFLKDLGVTIEALPNGSAQIDLGWFGPKIVSVADLGELVVWAAQLNAATT